MLLTLLACEGEPLWGAREGGRVEGFSGGGGMLAAL